MAPRWGSRAPCGRPFVPRFQDSDFELGIWDLGFGISAGLPAVIPALKCLLSPASYLLSPLSYPFPILLQQFIELPTVADAVQIGVHPAKLLDNQADVFLWFLLKGHLQML